MSRPKTEAERPAAFEEQVEVRLFGRPSRRPGQAPTLDDRALPGSRDCPGHENRTEQMATCRKYSGGGGYQMALSRGAR